VKRSEINTAIATAQSAFFDAGWNLPQFANWEPGDWPDDASSISEVLDRSLGWDVTDFGTGDYNNNGLCLVTLRNGSLGDQAAGHGKVYAEKLLYVGVDQVTPLHRHHRKQEDIINRSGGDLVLRLYPSTADGGLGSEDVSVVIDAGPRTVAAGDTVTLRPGESISLPTGVYHSFWATGEPCVAGEVSSVNDDVSDNVFYEPLQRFPELVEDEEPLRLLVGDYERLR
jgi:D-lyxose ketol-isomerase